MDRTIVKRRILPPGDLENMKVVFGILWVKLGDLKMVKDTSRKIKLQFWGEEEGVILQAANSVEPEENRRAEYEVRSPVGFFQKYLNDMKGKCKLVVEGVGNVSLDFRPFFVTYLIKQCRVTERSKQAFEHFKGVFEIVNNGKKVGGLEIEAGCNFNPDIYELDVEDNIECQCQRHCIEREEECDCECHNDEQIKKAIDVLAVKQPWKLDQISQKIQVPKQSLIKDNRIPNSLNTQMPSNKQFIPQKYKDQLLPQIQSNPSPKSSPQQILTPQINYFQSHHESEIKSPQNLPKSPQILFTHQQIEEHKQTEEFPDIEKVLTYSNLQLEKQLGVQRDEEEQKQLKKEFYGEDLSNNESFKRVGESSSPNQLIRNSSEHVRSLQVSPTPVTDRIVENSYEKKQSDPSDNEEKVLRIAPYEMKQSSKLASPKNSMISPKNSIISPRQYAFQPQLQSQHFNANSFSNPALNSTSLLLNLHCQISSIKLQSPVLFHLIYKIYGNADRNRIDYKGQPITILSPIGSQQLKLMDKLPFIVQIRNTRDKSKFIGFIKISLQKIRDAFLINGNINEKAVKANIMPTIIFQGQTPITEIKGDIVGRSFVNLILGTGQQLSNYINTKQKQTQKQSPQANKQIITQASDTSLNFCELLCEFLQFLKTNNLKIADSLLKLLSHKQLNLENYSTFIQAINKIQFIALFNLFDYKKRGTFPVKILADSFQEFNKVCERLKQGKQTSQELWKKNVDRNIMISIQSNSEFGLVSKDKLQRVLQELTPLRPDEIENILKQTSESYFSIEELKNGLVSTGVSYSPVVYGQTVSDIIRDSVIDSDLELGDLLASFNQKRVLNIEEVNRVFRNLPESLSLWSTFMLMAYIKKVSKDKNMNTLEIGYPELCNWCLALKQNVQKEKFRRKDAAERKQEELRLEQEKQRKQREEEINRKKKVQQQIAIENEQRNNKSVEPTIIVPEVNLDNTQMLSETIKQNVNDESLKQQQKHPRTIDQKPNIQQPSISQQKQPSIPKQQPQEPQQLPSPQLLSHNFSLEGIELSLDNHSAGQCLVSYKFPQQQQLIISKTIHINSSKHKYPIRLLGKHSINLNTPIENYLGDSVLKIDVSLDGKIFCTSGIPCNELLESGTKVVGLFTTAGEKAKLTGKLKLEINYHKQVSKLGQLGQTISKQMYLPKVGYLNVEISSAIDAKKLAQQHKIKQDFFLSMSFNPFIESPQLLSLYKPLQSKVQSAMSQIVYLRDHLKLRLSSSIIEYMKNHSVKIYLIAVYYKQESSTNRRNEMVLGTIDIPMLSIISGRGIHGDYAFKSKFGIFMGLARCDISYDKNKIEPVVPTTKLHAQQKVYIVVNILQFLNLSEPMKWISFQSTVKIHHSTPRNHLSGNKLFAHLQSSSFLFEIEDIYELTFISVMIKNSLHLNLSFDINMRPIINSLSKHRHTAYSSYFTVAGEEIQHMRVGAKIFAFRGNQIASEFASRLHQNPQANIFQYLSIPKQLDNYPKLVDLLRQQLSIQKSTFDQYISYLLQPKQRFNIQLFSNRIFFRLDFLQLYSQSPLLSLCQQSSTILSPQQIMHLLRKNEIEILGFKNEDTLEKFKFRNLDLHRIDRNIQLFSLEEMVDVITLIRKIEIPEVDSVMQQESFGQSYKVYVFIEKGKNFESLYNGIKPNAMVRCNGLDLETSIAQRESNPEYNQQFQFQLSAQDLNKIRKLHFEIRHKTSLDSSKASDILIGRATADISSALSFKDKTSSILFALPVIPNNSQHKALKKPQIIIRIRTQKISNLSYYNDQSAVNPSGFSQYSHSQQKIDRSIDIDRVADIMKQEVQMQMFEDSESENSYSQY